MSNIGLHGALRTPPINLHVDDDFYDLDGDPDRGDEQDDDFICGDCGSESWSYRGYGQYSQNCYYARGDRYVDWGDVDTDGFDDTDSWQCSNGHIARGRNAMLLSEVD